jgi:hypothetical protein
MYGKEWRSVQNFVRTRSSTQARSHAQKFFEKLKKKNKTLETFLTELNFDEIDNLNCSDLEYEDENEMLNPQNMRRSSILNPSNSGSNGKLELSDSPRGSELKPTRVLKIKPLTDDQLKQMMKEHAMQEFKNKR